MSTRKEIKILLLRRETKFIYLNEILKQKDQAIS